MHDGIVVPIFFFLCVAVIWGAFILTRHKERISMIDKGLKSDDIKALYAGRIWKISPLSSLKWGMIFIGIGLAVLLASWLHNVYMWDEGVYPGLITLFGGLGLLCFYLIAQRKVKD